MKKFYTYIHKRKDNNQIFYVGVGTKLDEKYTNKYQRAGSSDRNIIWKRIKEKAGGFTWEIVFESDSEWEVKQKEIDLIKLYGRLDNKTGILSNMTDGGDGRMNGTYESYEGNRRTLAIEREKRKKKCYQYDLYGNFIREWDSITEASNSLNQKSTTGIIKCCKNKIKFFKAFIWRYEYFDKLEVSFEVKKYDKIYQYNIEGDLIREWNNPNEINKFYSKKTNILRALKYDKLFDGYRWSRIKVNSLSELKWSNGDSRNIFEYNKIYQYSIDGDFIKEWRNATEVYEVYDVINKNRNLQRAVENINNTLYGFRWSCVKFDKLEKIVRKSNIPRKIYQYDDKYNLIGEYKLLKEASFISNIPKSQIRQSLWNKSKTKNNHYWLYEKI
jgi:hypothetical protein